MKKLRLNGHATICESAKLPEDLKDKTLKAAEGKVKVLEATIQDVDGREVVIRGKLKRSQKGSLKCQFSTVIRNWRIVEVDADEDGTTIGVAPLDQLAEELLMS